jgi:flagellar biosynthesis/type III secretory pathway M-ring protein FliF/YscJ
MEFLIVLVVLCVVVLVVTSPLWRPRADGKAGSAPRAGREQAELEAAREAKYREIRDAELDYRTGKLSETDYEAIDTTLRAQAMEILRALDRVKAG